MTEVQRVFIDVLKDFIFDRRNKLQELSDRNLIYNYASKHQLLPVFYYQLRDLLKDETEFASAYYAQICRSVIQRDTVKKIDSILGNIEHIYVKGKEISTLYPVPLCRTMGDVDILIREGNRERVSKLLTQSGFKLIEKGETDDTYVFKDISIEIHSHLIHPEPGKELIISYFDCVWDYVESGKLNWNFHFIYIIVHLRYHLIARGVGFRQFLDIAIMTQKLSLNWNWIQLELDKIGLRDFTSKVLLLNEIWFDVKSPVKGVISEEFVERATDDIFEAGVFGFSGENREYNPTIAMMKNSNVTENTAKIRYMKYLLFPPYKTMVSIGEYSYINDCKALLPFAWLRRIIKKVVLKSERAQAIQKVEVVKNVDMNRSDYLSQWGL